jgi:hypothetical protein
MFPKPGSFLALFLNRVEQFLRELRFAMAPCDSTPVWLSSCGVEGAICGGANTAFGDVGAVGGRAVGPVA